MTKEEEKAIATEKGKAMPGINRRVATPEEITIGLGQSKDVGVSGASDIPVDWLRNAVNENRRIDGLPAQVTNEALFRDKLRREEMARRQQTIRAQDAEAEVRRLEANDHSQKYKQNIQELAVLPANWDSYGAPPPTREALLAAENVLQSKATLVPRSNGGVQIDWPGGSEISFNPDGSQEFDDVAVAAERPRVSADGGRSATV